MKDLIGAVSFIIIFCGAILSGLWFVFSNGGIDALMFYISVPTVVIVGAIIITGLIRFDPDLELRRAQRRAQKGREAGQARQVAEQAS